jgi:hypothetical protein
MATRPRYLLGKGELLATEVPGPKKPQTKAHPYTFSEARERLGPRLETVSTGLAALPREACPGDQSVAAVVLHPSYLAKSYFPERLFAAVGLEALGSKPVQVKPTKGAKTKEVHGKKVEIESPTVEIFVAGKRRSFEQWAQVTGQAARVVTPEVFQEELIRIEDVRVVPPQERLKPLISKTDNPLMEIVLHSGEDFVLQGFEAYLRTLDIGVDLDRRIDAQNLCFVPVRIPRELHRKVAEFSFLRVAREMPSLRELQPMMLPKIVRSAPFEFEPPDKAAPLDPQLRVAVFDGGVPAKALGSWVRDGGVAGLKAPVESFQEHGVAVTSALLFGSLKKGEKAPQPYCYVDHYRVFDQDTLDDPQEDLYPILDRIRSVLEQSPYQFVNLSIGPSLPVEDDDVHAWTAVLDELFSKGNTLATVAAGNTGHRDKETGLARVQVPSDAVNVLAVGASDSEDESWKRAGYSSLGPGRSPGRVKPDVLAFGGSGKKPFWVVDSASPDFTAATQGTSFSAPLVLRAGVALRAVLGPAVTPIALKGLLIHHSESNDHHIDEVGWGQIPSDLERILVCDEGTTHVVYQGTLNPKKYLRAPVPLPKRALSGMVTLKATFCFACETDPSDPFSYTRAGLDITFRPNETVFNFDKKSKKFSKEAKPKSFFTRKAFATETELRQGAQWWEPVLKAQHRFRGEKLLNAAFDIHYNPREGGAGHRSPKPIPYVLVLTINAPKEPKIYDEILDRYPTILQPLQPVKLPVNLRL